MAHQGLDIPRWRRLIWGTYLLITSDWPSSWGSLRRLRRNGVALPLGLVGLRITQASYRWGMPAEDYFRYGLYGSGGKSVPHPMWATKGYMYAFHEAMNQRDAREEIDDKISFANVFEGMAIPTWNVISTDGQALERVACSIQGHGGSEVVVKLPKGRAGSGVWFATVTEDGTWTSDDGRRGLPVDWLQSLVGASRVVIQPRVVQHPRLCTLAPAGLNTIRIVTALMPDGDVRVLGAALRMTIGERVDNFSQGNIAAAVDSTSGIVMSDGAYKDVHLHGRCAEHPISGVRIQGFEVPKWDRVLELVVSAARRAPRCRSVGWDVAVTEEGPILVEGNTTWGKDTLQIPSGRSIRSELDAVLRAWWEAGRLP